MASYNLLFSHGATTSAPVLFPNLLYNPVLAFDAKILLERGKDWIRVGWVEPVVLASLGASGTKLVSGTPHRIVKGFHEVQLMPPDLPFQLKFMPKRYVLAWSIDVYEKIVIPTAEPIGLDAYLLSQQIKDLEAKIDAL
jgi:hypothetical protein